MRQSPTGGTWVDKVKIRLRVFTLCYLWQCTRRDRSNHVDRNFFFFHTNRPVTGYTKVVSPSRNQRHEYFRGRSRKKSNENTPPIVVCTCAGGSGRVCGRYASRGTAQARNAPKVLFKRKKELGEIIDEKRQVVIWKSFENFLNFFLYSPCIFSQTFSLFYTDRKKHEKCITLAIFPYSQPFFGLVCFDQIEQVLSRPLDRGTTHSREAYDICLNKLEIREETKWANPKGWRHTHTHTDN